MIGEHKLLMNICKEENIKPSIALKKTGVAKNIIHLKKMSKKTTVNPKIEQYLRPVGTSRTIAQEIPDDTIFESDQ